MVQLSPPEAEAVAVAPPVDDEGEGSSRKSVPPPLTRPLHVPYRTHKQPATPVLIR